MLKIKPRAQQLCNLFCVRRVKKSERLWSARDVARVREEKNNGCRIKIRKSFWRLLFWRPRRRLRNGLWRWNVHGTGWCSVQWLVLVWDTINILGSASWPPHCRLDLWHRCGWEFMDYPLYSPDLILSDLLFFGPLKKHSAVKGYTTDTDVEQAVTTWLQILDTDFFCVELQALVPQWVIWFEVVTMWKSDVYHMLHIYHVYTDVRIKF
jgi:hypothetical protein